MIEVLFMLCSAVFLSASVVLQKQGMKEEKKFSAHIILQKRWLLGLVLGAASGALYFAALNLANISRIQPLVALSQPLVALLGLKFLGDRIDRNEWLGVILVFLGSILVIV